MTIYEAGEMVDEATWTRKKDDFLPSDADGDFITGLMQPVAEPGKFASWIAPPARGVNGLAVDFEYVRLG